MNLINELLEGARKEGACQKARGVEDLDQLRDLYLSPEGLEFCINHNYPGHKAWKKIKEHWGKAELGKRNIFIDDPVPVLQVNPGTIILVGKKTEAFITATGADEIQRIIALHGAKAKLGAKDYAVVDLIFDKDSRIEYELDKTSILL